MEAWRTRLTNEQTSIELPSTVNRRKHGMTPQQEMSGQVEIRY